MLRDWYTVSVLYSWIVLSYRVFPHHESVMSVFVRYLDSANRHILPSLHDTNKLGCRVLYESSVHGLWPSLCVPWARVHTNYLM